MLKIILDILMNRYKCKKDPVKYSKSLGVKVGEGTVFYGAKVEMFNTEPWVITIGKQLHITAGVLFVTHYSATLSVRDECGPWTIFGNIVLGDNMYVGIRTIILTGVHIGDNAIIGADSVVTNDIPANAVAAGVPCRVIGNREKYIEKVNRIKAREEERYYSDLDYMHSLNPHKTSKI
ncbi:MAG: acyltransferase [Ruminococcus sp.]